MTLVVVGGTVVDVIFPGVKQLPGWPNHTEFTPTNIALLTRPPVVTLGGNGANAAFVAARRGAEVRLYSAIADDALGKLARQWLRDAGCWVITTGAAKSTAMNVTAANDRLERATLFYPGEPNQMPDFGRCLPTRGKTTAVLVCGWPHPPLTQIARSFRSLARNGVLTALDTGPILTKPWTLRALQPVLNELRLLLTNEFEVRAITKSSSISQAVIKLRRTCTSAIVIKCGARGIVWLPTNSSEQVTIPGNAVCAVNTVGAGDGFNGALLAALLRGDPFRDSLEEANMIAAQLVASPRGVLGVKRRGSGPAFRRRPSHSE
ncbi:MAG TPA: carbohydrate kinase family protein [Opitutus sp.]|nr:carbohydrate kinase family protein [Opitutus sp.]